MNNDPLVVAAGGKEVNVESISKGYKPFEITTLKKTMLHFSNQSWTVSTT
jgi:hypothetical protein